ncbi:MAG: tetratricopeptide repeat protein [Pyrinomonadaceae bacterium]
MSLKILKFEPKRARVFLIIVALICIVATWFIIKWNFANAVSSRIDVTLPESKLVVDWLTGVAPSDPQTHYTSALLLEKTFDSNDLARSLREYELTTALSPHNYVMWLNLGKARSQNGDPDGAAVAYQRALELAPNYAAVQWVYGNSLLRQGEMDEGFALIARSAASSADFSRTAVATALQIFDGDLIQVRRVLGDNDVTNAALVTALPGSQRFNEAVEAWSKLGAEDKTDKFSKLGETLAGQLAEAKKYQLAARLAADSRGGEAEKPVVGQVSNGGFENGVKLRNAGLFEWHIAEGGEPQIGLSEAQKRSGNYALFMLFNSFDSASFRVVSQTVAVDPGAEYEFEVFYRSDLKTSAVLKWEIADAATTAPIASTPPMATAGDWTSLKVKFIVPRGGDGVLIRLVREGCTGVTCPMTGKAVFDDFSLRRV